MASCADIDDVFDDEFRDECVIGEIEWSKIKSSRVTEGYRAGIEAGQDQSLQEGFNQGYRQAALLAAEVARIKGSLSAVLSYHLLKGEELLTEKAEKELQDFLLDISALQNEMSFRRQTATESHNEFTEITKLANGLGLIDVPDSDRNTVKTDEPHSGGRSKKCEGKYDSQTAGVIAETGSGDTTLEQYTEGPFKSQSSLPIDMETLKTRLQDLLTVHSLHHLV